MSERVEGSPDFYDIEINSLDGNRLDLTQFRGDYLLIVNTASACGFTPQYAILQELHESGKMKILGCPCNDFGGQEPGSSEEIKEFCTGQFGVGFQLTEKVKIKGDDVSPLYDWLISKAREKSLDDIVEWNFHKFLIDPNGDLVASLPAAMSPDDPKLLELVSQINTN